MSGVVSDALLLISIVLMIVFIIFASLMISLKKNGPYEDCMAEECKRCPMKDRFCKGKDSTTKGESDDE